MRQCHARDSSQAMNIMHRACHAVSCRYPEHLRQTIDDANEWIYSVRSPAQRSTAASTLKLFSRTLTLFGLPSGTLIARLSYRPFKTPSSLSGWFIFVKLLIGYVMGKVMNLVWRRPLTTASTAAASRRSRRHTRRLMGGAPSLGMLKWAAQSITANIGHSRTDIGYATLRRAST